VIESDQLEAEIRDIEVDVYSHCIERGTHLFNKGSYFWIDEYTGEKLVQCKICCCMIHVDEEKNE